LSPDSTPIDGAALPRRSLFLRRALIHAAGLALAGLLGWLAWRGYGRPEFLLDFANAVLLC